MDNEGPRPMAGKEKRHWEEKLTPPRWPSCPTRCFSASCLEKGLPRWCKEGGVGLTPGSGRSPREGDCSWLQVFLPKEPHGQWAGWLQSMESQRQTWLGWPSTHACAPRGANSETPQRRAWSLRQDARSKTQPFVAQSKMTSGTFLQTALNVILWSQVTSWLLRV